MQIRRMDQEDLEQVMAVSGLHERKLEEYLAYSTLVADAGAGIIAGFCQFSIDPITKILQSYTLWVKEEYRGQGVARALLRCQRNMAKAVGSMNHLYAVLPVGKEALQKLLLSEGLHLCQTYENLLVYSGGL